jgi:hypothetical protein
MTIRKQIQKQLDALRLQHGANTPIGHRCSNLIGQLENYETATGDQRKDLQKFISKSVADLAKLTAR